jgi:pimeloyl-ACP methyl ester carboxylesterase
VPQKYLTIGDTATLVHHRGATTLPGSPPHTDRGATIVCLHEAGTSGAQFSDLMDHLAADHSPLSFDQPGHGRSGGLDALPSIEAMAGQLHSLLGAWSIERPVLVGEGLGGVVALQAAAGNPELASALVLIGGLAESRDLDDEIESLAAITSGKARREFDRTGYAPETDRAVYQKAFGYWVKTDPRATLGARRAQAAWSLSGPPAVPVMIVVGEHEDPASVAAAEELAGRLPNGSVHRLGGAGRRGVLEQPERLAADISAFLTAEGVTGAGETA